MLPPTKQHQPLLRVPLTALVQVRPWRVPALIDGGIVPQRWGENSDRHAHYMATPGQKMGFCALKPLLSH